MVFLFLMLFSLFGFYSINICCWNWWCEGGCCRWIERGLVRRVSRCAWSSTTDCLRPTDTRALNETHWSPRTPVETSQSMSSLHVRNRYVLVRLT